ncbi:uncharacterized protein E0L32_003760 [Thyridium curvatum]|uniref:Xylanolytic transcriptional activator regulatory domain-containing protein n=1 Tax=Thyridium curvatum TaxID=1093900 RepID=A0A507BB58_9PEZI|nr:uncharacterized protein E0L32_003760 [Thyridium curvatum]TPX16466.1 hypothetical protein E0L32_003760 [Thyridium curvatum]
MFKFVSDDVGGVGAKRKNSRKTCESCKKRHKRCTHTDGSQNSGPARSPGLSSTVSSIANTGIQKPPSQIPSGPQAAVESDPRPVPAELARARQTRKSYLRFVGDLSPEASFLSGGRKDDGGGNHPRHADVGVWLGGKPEETHATDDVGESGPSARHRDGPLSQPSGLSCLKTLSAHLRKECLSVLPPEYEFTFISELYYAKFDPIYPILHREVLEQYNPMEATALKQCICLVASLDPALKGQLRLPHTERILPQTEFRACVAAAIKQSLDMGFILDRVVLLQVCALMAFYVDRPSCSELSSYYCAQVVHHSQTLGLHLGWPDDSIQSEKSHRLFWCVWVLDRLNAAINGRPVLYHSRDMDMKITDSVPDQMPSFRLVIRITELLDEAISRYRPNPDSAAASEAAGEDLTFENLVRETQTAEVGDALLASLELFFLAVLILRSRPKAEYQGSVARGPSTSLQYFCASSIVSIASEEFKSSMTFWVAVPYAVSLAASVAYKTLRNSSVPYQRKRAYGLFHSSCEVLEELGKGFLSARAMARLATDTLQQVERAAVGRKMAKTQEDSARTSTNGNLSRGENHAPARTPDAPGFATLRPAASSSQAPNEATGEPSESQTMTVMSSQTPGLDATLLSLDANSNNTLDDFIGDAGIFNDFDPNFDLSRIDAIFSANLDPGLPPLPSGLFDMDSSYFP